MICRFSPFGFEYRDGGGADEAMESGRRTGMPTRATTMDDDDVQRCWRGWCVMVATAERPRNTLAMAARAV